MLAAGGYASAVQLWDTRASTSPSVSLPIPDKDAVTSLSCSAATGRVVAGTMSGRACVWDLRKVSNRRPQVWSRVCHDAELHCQRALAAFGVGVQCRHQRQRVGL